jgi:uncharacterized membrane protein
MKTAILVSLLLLAAFFDACKREKKVLPDIQMPGDSTISEGANVNSGSKTFKGLFVVGRKLLSFRECDHPEKDLAVNDSTGKMKELYKAALLHSPAFPYEYVYVEVEGKTSVASAEDVKLGFDSLLTVTNVLTFEQKNYQNSCIPYDFWALGENWSLQISEKEGILVLKDFSAMNVFVFEYFPPRNQNDEVFTYTANNYAAGTAIKATIRMESCFEESSRNGFQYSATVIINGRSYHGCAIKGAAPQ